MNGTKYIYLRDGKTGNWSIFDLDKRNELHEIAYMQRDPWFVDATRIGKTIIWIDQNYTKLNIYTIANKLRLTADDITSESRISSETETISPQEKEEVKSS